MTGKPIMLTLAIAAWLTLSFAGFAFQSRYDNTSGQPAIAPTSWPTDAAIRPTGDSASILLFLHPHCPCSRATLDQLQRALLHASSPVACHILFVTPPGTEPGWERGPLLRQAQGIPGATTHTDALGTEAARFGAATSGQIMLYDLNGRLLFRGGITRSRGHEGDCAASRSLAELLRGHTKETSTHAPVFGCPLFDQPSPASHAQVDGCCTK